MVLTLTFRKKQNGTLVLFSNNTLVKEFAFTLERVVNKFFLENEKDNEFVVVNYKHKFDFVIVGVKHKTKNILDYFKEIKAERNLENLFWSFDRWYTFIKFKRYKNEDELSFAKTKIKEILGKAKKIKNEFPAVYLSKKAELEERFAI